MGRFAVDLSLSTKGKMQDRLSRHQIDASGSRVLGGMVTAAMGKNGVGFFGNKLHRLMGVSCLMTVFGVAAFDQSFADSTKATIPRETSTIPSIGDENPYGVAFVPEGFPATNSVAPGDILVSNFNNNTNTQGTGTTIVSISPDGTQNLFFGGTPPLGLTTALNVLKAGFVIVGNLTNNMGVPQPPGSLIVLDKDGKQLTGSPLVDPTFLDGPWDSTVIDKGNSAIVFVSCVLNGTVTRLELIFSGNTVAVKSKVKIAEGYKFGTNKAAFVVGPTGLAYDADNDTLYVASTKDNAIFAVADAAKTATANGPGTVVFSDANHLHGPLGLVLAPNGDLISSQGDAINDSKDPAQQSEIVEFTKGAGGQPGTFVSQFSIDSAVGSAFGIDIQTNKGVVTFAAVDDTMNALTVYNLTQK
jgi:hypothetical protein